MPTQFMKLGFEDRVIRQDGFYNVLLNGRQVGFNLDLRINYYRGLPLSSVQKIELTVDGENIPEYLMLFELNGKQFTVGQLRELYTEYWGIKTPAHLKVFNYGLEPGEHDVAVRIEYKSPYMEFAPGVYGMIDGSEEKKMIIGDGREM
ncbi:MAG: C-glycoside deglycosidase beta subunit domain-containing protein [Eubacteriaceae bacterium]|jgi:hypothetical protein